MNRIPVVNEEGRKSYTAPTTDVEADKAGKPRRKPAKPEKPAPVAPAPLVP